MRKPLVPVAVVALLALNFLALDDITTGREPNHTLEYLVVAGSVIFFGSLGLHWLCRLRRPRRHPR